MYVQSCSFAYKTNFFNVVVVVVGAVSNRIVSSTIGMPLYIEMGIPLE